MVYGSWHLNTKHQTNNISPSHGLNFKFDIQLSVLYGIHELLYPCKWCVNVSDCKSIDIDEHRRLAELVYASRNENEEEPIAYLCVNAKNYKNRKIVIFWEFENFNLEMLIRDWRLFWALHGSWKKKPLNKSHNNFSHWALIITITNIY